MTEEVPLGIDAEVDLDLQLHVSFKGLHKPFSYPICGKMVMCTANMLHIILK